MVMTLQSKAKRLATVIQHTPLESDGILRSVLLANGYDVQVVDATTADLKVAYRSSDLVLLMGAPIGAYEADLFPFMRREVDELARRLQDDAPIFGVGLGAHLIASALGARVYPGPRCELGWLALTLTAEGRQSALHGLEGTPMLHWHEDTFELPAGATRLASTDAYPNQAFAWGRNTLAVQFHLEASASMISQWLVAYRAQLRHVGADLRALRNASTQLAPASEHAGVQMFANWVAGLARSREPEVTTELAAG